jgi:hypothetical protein
MLVQYVRDKKGMPYAVVVATDSDQIGYSVCNKNDTFIKDRGKDIAEGRSKKYNFDEMMQNYQEEMISLYRLKDTMLSDDFDEMMKRHLMVGRFLYIMKNRAFHRFLNNKAKKKGK